MNQRVNLGLSLETIDGKQNLNYQLVGVIWPTRTDTFKLWSHNWLQDSYLPEPNKCNRKPNVRIVLNNFEIVSRFRELIANITTLCFSNYTRRGLRQTTSFSYTHMTLLQNSVPRAICTSTLGNNVRTIWSDITIIIVQLYLPPKSSLKTDFLRLVLRDKKKLLRMDQVHPINVPKFDELSVKKLAKVVLKDPTFKDYFPDYLDNE